MPYKGSFKAKILEQMECLCSTMISFQFFDGKGGLKHNGENVLIAEAYSLNFGSRDTQDESLLPNFITLSKGMWEQLKAFPVPIDLAMDGQCT